MSRSTTITFLAPRFAKWMQSAFPIPFAPPVTTHMDPLGLKVLLLLLIFTLYLPVRVLVQSSYLLYRRTGLNEDEDEDVVARNS